MINISHHRLKINDSDFLHVQVRNSEKGSHLPLIVFSHGFITDGLENHRLFLSLAAFVNTLGYSTLLFDYRNCGYSDGEFKDFRLTRAIEDLTETTKWGLKNSINSGKVVILGQSLGTITSVFSSIELQKLNLVSSSILLNLSGNNNLRYQKIFGNHILKNGTYLFPKGFYVVPEMFEDIFKYDVLKIIENIQFPLCFINAGNDKIGDSSISQNALMLSNNTLSSRVVIEHSDHSFTRLEEKKILFDAIEEWLKSTI